MTYTHTPFGPDENPTPQEILDRAYLGVMRQGRLGEDASGDPRYRLGCVIGQLISKEAAEAWDGLDDPSIGAVLNGYDDEESESFENPHVRPWMLQNAKLLDDIQSAHDKSAREGGLLDFWRHMARAAKRHSLTLPEWPEATP